MEVIAFVVFAVFLFAGFVVEAKSKKPSLSFRWTDEMQRDFERGIQEEIDKALTEDSTERSAD